MLSTQAIDPSIALTRSDLRDRVSSLFLRFIQELHAGPAEPWLDLHLTMPQLKMLFVADWLGPISMSRVAAHLRLSLSAATGLVDRLVEAGLARREADPHDRRVVRVSCTSEGRALVLKLHSAGGERLGRILERLSDAELQQCLLAMGPVNRAVEMEFQEESSIPAESGSLALGEAQR